MVSCYEEGFRLADAVSECSMRSKARIDTLFEDTRSICSSATGGWCAGSTNYQSLGIDELGTEEQIKANGAVQARIEAMFASVEAETGTPGKSAAAILPVKYMGAAPVGGRVASVRGLQEPLRQLLERIDNSTSAELEISRRGLIFRTSETLEKTNPFRRIAVWSALRLRSKETGGNELRHAFLPLVNDDQAPGINGDDKHADLYRAMKGLSSEARDYPPIFAVVMRRPGAARLLECHAFACKMEEDAIAAAATLYRALLADLDANRRRPRQSNGLGCVSLASVASSIVEPSILGSRSIFGSNTQNSRITAPGSSGTTGHPVRPPRSKKTSVSSLNSEKASSLRSVKLDKAPRKKKVSEIKAEDILEARSRKSGISKSKITDSKAQREAGSTGRNSALSGHESNSDPRNACNVNHGNGKCRNSRSRNEERNNARNKLMCQGTKMALRGNEENAKPRYECDDLYSRGHRAYNNYEKLPKISKSFDYKNDPRVNYSYVERNGNGACEVSFRAKSDNRCEDNEASYNKFEYDVRTNLSESRFSDKRESSSRSRSNVSRGGENPGSKNRENSIYSNGRTISERLKRDEIYEEHFKDADKISSIDNEDFGIMGKRRNTINSNSRQLDEENFTFSRAPENSWSRQKIIKDGGIVDAKDFENLETTTRLSRINTMDKPMRNRAKNELSRTSEQEDPSKFRKRTRAGSEPPVSRIEETMKNQPQESKLKRSQSDVEVDRGDPMTRVELPRRGSFLKPSSTRLPNNVNGGTPLGFSELFDEFRNQEGLTSVDDILAAIIDPEGMSFNDLKPLYKEFLLKLAGTLTQDELYQRSASIMRRRRRPQRRRSTRKPCLLGRAIRRSVSRFKGGPTEFTSVIFPARKLNDSFDSSSSCEARNNRKRVLASRLSRRRSSWRNTKSGVGQTTSEDSDTCRRLARNGALAANRSSSGYVSCSECSYDSESCTCVSADKCYCSLSRRVPVEPAPINAVVCGCDTDSCSESNKCYCATKSSQPTILEQLRQRGIVPSESSLSRAGSPERGRASKTNRSHASSKSLEFLKIRPSPGRSGSDNFALDYDLFSPGKKSTNSPTGSEKVLLVSARDPQGRLVYVGGAERDKKCFDNESKRAEAHHEALSIKKSAEIAAVFGPGSVRTCRRASSICSARSSVSLEAGLGYLP